MMIQRNLFQTIRQLGYDDDFAPYAECSPTAAFPGSPEKVTVLRERLEAGQDLWHPNDERLHATIEMSRLSGDMCRLMTEQTRQENAATRAERLEAYGRSGSEGWRRSRCKERVG